MAKTLIRTGYDFTKKYTLKLDGTAENLSTASLIEASLVSGDKLSELIVDTAQTNTGGADWANGVVVVNFTAAQTAAIALGDAWIELAVVLGGLRLPYDSIPVVVEKGWTL